MADLRETDLSLPLEIDLGKKPSERRALPRSGTVLSRIEDATIRNSARTREEERLRFGFACPLPKPDYFLALVYRDVDFRGSRLL